MNREKIKAKFREVSKHQLRINIVMKALDEMVEIMPEKTAWRGWRYSDWTDEEILFFRDLIYMNGGWRRYKNKKPPTSPLPRDGSSIVREDVPRRHTVIDESYEK